MNNLTRPAGLGEKKVSALDLHQTEGRIAGIGSPQGPIFQGPEFRGPEIKPHRNWLEKVGGFIASRTPQEKGALIGLFGTFTVTLLLSLTQCSRVSNENALLKHDNQNLERKIREHESTIGKLTTEKASAENRAATFEAIPSQVPALISNVNTLIAADPTNRTQLLGILLALQNLTHQLTDVSMATAFDLYLNNIKVTNGASLKLPSDGKISIVVSNTSPIAAGKTTFSCQTKTATNINTQPNIGVPVSMEGPPSIAFAVVQRDETVEGRLRPHTVFSQDWAGNLAGNSIWRVGEVFMLNPPVQVEFRIYAGGSKTARYFVTFQQFPSPAVVIPLATQQYLLLQRNLVYTGITRGKKLVVVVGQRKALAIAVRNNKTEQRFSGLLARLIA